MKELGKPAVQPAISPPPVPMGWSTKIMLWLTSQPCADSDSSIELLLMWKGPFSKKTATSDEHPGPPAGKMEIG